MKIWFLIDVREPDQTFDTKDLDFYANMFRKSRFQAIVVKKPSKSEQADVLFLVKMNREPKQIKPLYTNSNQYIHDFESSATPCFPDSHPS